MKCEICKHAIVTANLGIVCKINENDPIWVETSGCSLGESKDDMYELLINLPYGKKGDIKSLSEWFSFLMYSPQPDKPKPAEVEKVIHHGACLDCITDQSECDFCMYAAKSSPTFRWYDFPDKRTTKPKPAEVEKETCEKCHHFAYASYCLYHGHETWSSSGCKHFEIKKAVDGCKSGAPEKKWTDDDMFDFFRYTSAYRAGNPFESLSSILKEWTQSEKS